MTGKTRLRILLRADREGAAEVVAALQAAGHDAILVADDADLATRLEEAPADLVLVDAPGAAPGGLQSALEENTRLRTAVSFARTTAHDLAQPLTTIMARSQLLASKAKPDDPSYKPLKVISDEATKLADMVVRFQKLKEMV